MGARVEEAERSLAQSRSLLSAVRADLQAANARADGTRERDQAAAQELGELRGKVTSAEVQLTRLQGQLREAEADGQAQGQRASALGAKVEELERVAEEERAAHGRASTARSSALERETAEQLAQALAKAAEQEATVKALEEEARHAGELLQREQQRSANAGAKVEELERRVVESRTLLGAARADAETANARVDDSREQQAEIALLRDQLRDVQAQTAEAAQSGVLAVPHATPLPTSMHPQACIVRQMPQLYPHAHAHSHAHPHAHAHLHSRTRTPVQA